MHSVNKDACTNAMRERHHGLHIWHRADEVRSPGDGYPLGVWGDERC